MSTIEQLKDDFYNKFNDTMFAIQLGSSPEEARVLLGKVHQIKIDNADDCDAIRSKIQKLDELREGPIATINNLFKGMLK